MILYLIYVETTRFDMFFFIFVIDKLIKIIYNCTVKGTKRCDNMEYVREYDKLKKFLLENGIEIDYIAYLINSDSYLVKLKINREGEDFTLEEVRIICSHYKLDANDFFLI